MVKLSQIKECNSRIDDASSPRVAVFIGGTAGIGKITLDALTELGKDLKVYIIGRKESEGSFRSSMEELFQANPKVNLIWIEGEVSLLSEVKRICDHIKALETKIDLLFLTTGYTPFTGRMSSEPFSQLHRTLTQQRHIRGPRYQPLLELLRPHLRHQEPTSFPPSLRKRTRHQRSCCWC